MSAPASGHWPRRLFRRRSDISPSPRQNPGRLRRGCHRAARAVGRPRAAPARGRPRHPSPSCWSVTIRHVPQPCPRPRGLALVHHRFPKVVHISRRGTLQLRCSVGRRSGTQPSRARNAARSPASAARQARRRQPRPHPGLEQAQSMLTRKGRLMSDDAPPNSPARPATWPATCRRPPAP